MKGGAADDYGDDVGSDTNAPPTKIVILWDLLKVGKHGRAVIVCARWLTAKRSNSGNFEMFPN